MGRASGRRRLRGAPRKRWLAVAAAVIAVASGAAGYVQLAGHTGAPVVVSRAGGTGAGVTAAGADKVAGGSAGGSSPVRASGPPDGGLSAAAAGPLPPSVITTLNRDKHYPRPVTSSARGRFNVAEPHSPELLRELSGSPGGTGASQPGGPGKTAAPASPAPATTTPGSSAPAPGNPASPAPAPSGTAEARTTALVTAAAAADAASAMQGIDVASFQHAGGAAINWAQVAAAGYKFAAVKGTEGNYYTNPNYGSDVTGARAAGLYVTGYHFAIPNVSTAVNQADYAVANGAYAGDGRTLPLELDVEYDPYTSSDHTNECYGLTAAQMVLDRRVQRRDAAPDRSAAGHLHHRQLVEHMHREQHCLRR